MEKKVFAKGFCFAKIFIFFLVGCLFGTYYEEILWFFNNGEWVNRQGLIYGPFSPIYGILGIIRLSINESDISICFKIVRENTI